MQEIKVKDILQVTKGKLITGKLEEICEDYNNDSRKIKEGEIFVGIIGENVNGGAFFEQAFENGAKGCIIQDVEISEEQKEKYKNKIIIIVESTAQALKQIAILKRTKYNIPVIGITGSVGKTSTKDLVASVVSQKYKTLETQRNRNGQMGLPLTLLQLKNEEVVVLEMGMSHFNEMRELTNIAKPTIVAINNIGTAHIGNLGSRENILKAKLEILEGMVEPKIIVINNDNDILHKWQQENKNMYNIVTFGIENESDYMAVDIESDENGSKYTLKERKNLLTSLNKSHQIINPNNYEEEKEQITNQNSHEKCEQTLSQLKQEEKIQIEVPVAGNHFILNSLCAVVMGRLLGVEAQKIKQGIKTFKLSKSRMDVIKKDGITIINDAYNANYDSVKAAIEYLTSRQEKRKIAVLGDMLELGEYSKELHEKVGEEIIKSNIDLLITVGEEAKNIANIAQKSGITTMQFNKNEEAISQLKQEMGEGECILIKASNSMHFDEIVKAITE